MHVRDLYIGDLMYHWYGGACCPLLQFQYSLQQCVGVCMCGFFDNCVHVLVISVFVFTVFCIVCTVFLYCFVYVYLFLFVTSVRSTAE